MYARLVGWLAIGTLVAGMIAGAGRAEDKPAEPAIGSGAAPATSDRAESTTRRTTDGAVADESVKKENAAPTTDSDKPADPNAKNEKQSPGETPAFVVKGVAWLIAAQHNDGGWGGGSHAHQDVRDPHAVQTDPATTAFTLLSLLRSGHTPIAGEYKPQVRRGLEYLLAAVEQSPDDAGRITTLEGTQPQTKLGRYVDTAMTAQYLARALAMLPKDDALQGRTDKALDVCLAKLQKSQQANGAWTEGGGWAPVLQSSLACSALELAAAGGKQVDKEVLKRARDYQKGNFDAKSGRVNSDAGAGVQLYAFGGAFRGNASDAAAASQILDKAKAEGRVAASEPVSADSLRKAGVTDEKQVRHLAAAAEQNAAQINKLNDEQLLSGFGNNGGEEFLSYLMTSETLVIAGGDKFHEWQKKMEERLAKIQNNDGSWSGHHCITSPVFCTAAVVQCLTTDHDREFLVAMAAKTAGGGQTRTTASDAVSK